MPGERHVGQSAGGLAGLRICSRRVPDRMSVVVEGCWVFISRRRLDTNGQTSFGNQCTEPDEFWKSGLGDKL